MRRTLFLGAFLFLLQCTTQTTVPTLTPVTTSAPNKIEKRYAFQKPRQNKGQTLYFSNIARPQTLDPGLATGSPDGRMIDALFDGLFETDPKTLEPVLALAASYEESPNKDHYIFHLRKGAKWSNGDPITAHDFVYSWERVLNPGTQAQFSPVLYPIQHAEDYLNERLRALTASIKIGSKQYQAGDIVRVLGVEPKPKDPVLPSSNLYRVTTPTALRQAPDDSAAVVEALGLGEISDLSDDALVFLLRVDGAWAKAITINSRRYGYVSMKHITLLGDKVKYQIEAPDQPGVTAWVGGKDLWLDPKVLGFSAKDDYTIEVQLTGPTPYFLSLLAHYTYKPVPQKTLEQHGLEWTLPENIVSSGAFLLDNQNVRRFVLKKNPNYWDAANVKLTQVTMTNLEDEQQNFQDYQDGKTDLLVGNALPTSDGLLARLAGMEDYWVVPSLGTSFYRLNTVQPPLDNVKVRRALSLTIDRSLLPGVLGIPFSEASSLTPPGVAGFSPPAWANFDPNAARALLAEAGYPEGRGFPEMTILFNSQESHRQVATFVQAQWKEHLGIKVKLESDEWMGYLNRVSNTDYQVARGGWIGDYLDATTFLDMFITGGGNNNTGWSNPAYDLLLKKAAAEPNESKRNELFTQLEKLLGEEAPLIPLYHYVWYDLVRPEVQGYYPNILDKHPLKFVSIKE